MNIDTIYIEITNKCNLNCITCYNHSQNNQGQKELPFERIKSLIFEMKKYGLKRILFSGGEPTLHSQFDRILDYCNEHSDFEFGIVTNGTIHNDKLIQTLNSSSNWTVQISLDGSNESINRISRGRNQFKKTIDFILNIKNSKAKKILKMVVMQQNLHDVESFYHMAYSLNCSPEFSFVFKSGNAIHDWSEKKVEDAIRIDVIKLIKKLNKKNDTNAFIQESIYGCPLSNCTNPMSLCIKSDGSIQPCQRLYSSIFTLSNAYAFDMYTFENKVKNLSLLISKRQFEDFGCISCMIKNFCKKGCPAEAFSLNGNINTIDNDCELRKLCFLINQMSSNEFFSAKYNKEAQ